MKYVGNELQRLALNEPETTNADLLGRSAFNRYYYAAFLVTRETLGFLNSGWKGTPHGNIPALLETNLKKKAKPVAEGFKRKGLMTQGDCSRILTEIDTVAKELAELLRHAYAARILADYEPEIKTAIKDKVIYLEIHKLTSAEMWPNRAEALCKRLRKVWKELGLA
ncbi:MULTISPECIES: hypothetical protein [Vibrionaceae]|nr:MULTISPECIES: hypothetical protein [Vibrionaceae]MBE4448597.1 hypothetical protein [Vibrio parahaemolyticus]MBT0080873.1 hypothetical protein [Vibrio alginolyticus]OXD31481.1 hypothetical protein CA162_16840 [Vibrio parahaemolyticus]HBC0006784.1 hypothetical protein [Vibrio parahaemolyticus]HBC0008459.1 hypothetical protein [Vibrio parahaemolyticus]